ncbi:MAG: hypothetical protein AB1540_15815 [Bdellovibrionota bacterium]
MTASLSRVRGHFGVLGAVVLLIFFAILQKQVRELGSGATALVPEPPKFIGISIDPRIVRRFLGVRLLVADLIWIDTMIKSDIRHEEMPFTAFYRAFKTITQLDPDNLFAYYIAGLYLSVIKDDVKGASAILRDGVMRLESGPYAWYEAWKIPFILGFNLLYEEHEIEEGSKWIQYAAKMPNAPEYVRSLSTKVSTERGQLEVGSRVLLDFYRRIKDEDQKKQIEKKLVELTVKLEIADLNEKFEHFLESTKAYQFPRERAFRLFLQSISKRPRDMLGRPLVVNRLGRIEALKEPKK